MEYKLYRVHDSKTGYSRTIMHSTDMNGMWMDRYWDFGCADVFDVARVLRIFNEISPVIDSISKTEYVRKYGKAAVAF